MTKSDAILSSDLPPEISGNARCRPAVRRGNRGHGRRGLARQLASMGPS